MDDVGLASPFKVLKSLDTYVSFGVVCLVLKSLVILHTMSDDVLMWMMSLNGSNTRPSNCSAVGGSYGRTCFFPSCHSCLIVGCLCLQATNHCILWSIHRLFFSELHAAMNNPLPIEIACRCALISYDGKRSNLMIKLGSSIHTHLLRHYWVCVSRTSARVTVPPAATAAAALAAAKHPGCTRSSWMCCWTGTKTLKICTFWLVGFT